MCCVDSLQPHRVRCDRCGHALPVALDVWDDPESLLLLTEDAQTPPHRSPSSFTGTTPRPLLVLTG
jgi:hypothetical protein